MTGLQCGFVLAPAAGPRPSGQPDLEDAHHVRRCCPRDAGRIVVQVADQLRDAELRDVGRRDARQQAVEGGVDRRQDVIEADGVGRPAQHVVEQAADEPPVLRAVDDDDERVRVVRALAVDAVLVLVHLVADQVHDVRPDLERVDCPVGEELAAKVIFPLAHRVGLAGLRTLTSVTDVGVMAWPLGPVDAVDVGEAGTADRLVERDRHRGQRPAGQAVGRASSSSREFGVDRDHVRPDDVGGKSGRRRGRRCRRPALPGPG